MNEYGLILAGNSQPARDNRCFDVLSPLTEQPMARVARAGVEEVNQAVTAARPATPRHGKAARPLRR